MCDKEKTRDSSSTPKLGPDGSLQITLPMPTIPWTQVAPQQQQMGGSGGKQKRTRRGKRGGERTRNKRGGRTRNKRGGSSNPSNGVYRKTYVGNVKTKVYAAYANHLGKMMSMAESQEAALLAILNSVFSTTKEQDSTVRRINPALTYESLDSAVAAVRSQIIALYRDCEKNYQKGINLLDAIIEYQYAETAKRRGENLRQQLDT